MSGPLTTESPALTYEQRRSGRKRAVRARTVSIKRMTKRELENGRLLHPEDLLTDLLRSERPRTRGECEGGQRPCPWVSCEHHLALEVLPRTGALRLNFPDLDVWEMHESCLLDVAERGGLTLEEVGDVMNVTRERVRQLEVRAMAKVKAAESLEVLRDFVSEGTEGKRRLPVLANRHGRG